MNKKLLVLTPLLLLAWVAVIAVAGNTVKVRAQSPVTCIWPFEATVRQGPNTGTTLLGDLTVDIAEDGALSGTLATQDNQSLAVVGQIVGRAVSLGFELQAPAADVTGMYVFGTGTAWQPVSPDTDCGGILGGTFAGPQPGDMGDWLVCVKVKIKGASLPGTDLAKARYGSAGC
jgi:hypothetical protein